MQHLTLFKRTPTLVPAHPAYGWRRFKRAEVRWHKHWLLGFPTDYWTFAITSGILLWFGYR